MNKQEIIKRTEEYVKETLNGESSGHDWWHVYRVWQMAKTIGEKEKVDMFIVEIGALLHDIADYKFHNGDETIGPTTARSWLESLNVNEKDIEHVCEIITHISFKGAHVESKMETKEGMVVQDADRLDALGAIGIARAFAYGGNKKRVMYDPSKKPTMHSSFDEYKNNTSTTVNHFYEKLLLLKDLMNTNTAREIAELRTNYMKDFLTTFYKEWEGEK